MKRSLMLVMVLVSGSAFAGANCPKNAKNEWIPEADAKAKIAAQGYNIKKFKVDGNCYEIYGTNKEGKNGLRMPSRHSHVTIESRPSMRQAGSRYWNISSG